MSDRPEPLRRLDELIAGATFRHEHIADLHLLAPDDQSTRLIRESADIALRQMPALTRDVWAAERTWQEQELLDPERAAETLRRIDAEMAKIEPDLRALAERQRQIVRELRDRR
ncbi:hypothetical protein [Georgenia sp.]